MFQRYYLIFKLCRNTSNTLPNFVDLHCNIGVGLNSNVNPYVNAKSVSH